MNCTPRLSRVKLTLSTFNVDRECKLTTVANAEASIFISCLLRAKREFKLKPDPDIDFRYSANDELAKGDKSAVNVFEYGAVSVCRVESIKGFTPLK